MGGDSTGEAHREPVAHVGAAHNEPIAHLDAELGAAHKESRKGRKGVQVGKVQEAVQPKVQCAASPST